MALEVIKNINVDFYDSKYIIVNAKQYDDASRWIKITCYNQGIIFNLSAKNHSVYVRYKKADGSTVLNFCKINNRGEILVELTEQMLAVGGICYVDLVVINKGKAMINIDTGEIIAVDDSSVLSTMAFCVNVYESSVDNSEIESSSEYEGLNELMQEVKADYQEVVQLAKSYAVGNAGGIRDNEDYNNAKYYYELSIEQANDASTSANNALTSEQNALNSENNAKTYMESAETSANNALTSEQNAKTSENNAKSYMENSAVSAENALSSEKKSENYSIVSRRYAIGDTGTVEGEETDNAKYYYEQTKGINDVLGGNLSPKGTISFEELENAEKFAGYLYVIENSFVTDDTFAEGSGVEYLAGTMVYYTVDGYWDCFEGLNVSTATVSEVKSYLGI